MNIVPDIQVKDKTEVVQKQEYKLIGSVNLTPGLTLYAIHLDNLTVEKVEISRKLGIDIHGNVRKESRASYQPNTIYIQALNEKNAIKKARKIIFKLTQNEN